MPGIKTRYSKKYISFSIGFLHVALLRHDALTLRSRFAGGPPTWVVRSLVNHVIHLFKFTLQTNNQQFVVWYFSDPNQKVHNARR
jgi:hypothetical protein